MKTITIRLKLDNDLSISSRLNHSDVEVVIIDNIKGIELELLPEEAWDLGERLQRFVTELGILGRKAGKPDRRKPHYQALEDANQRASEMITRAVSRRQDDKTKRRK